MDQKLDDPPSYASVIKDYQPPSYFEGANVDRLLKVMDKYEIHKRYVDKLDKLANYEIVMVCDDSGSMRNGVRNSYLEGKGFSQVCRWDELQYTTRIVMELASLIDENGIDVYFLNRGTFNGLHNNEQLQELFVDKPSGGTPLGRVMRQILKDKSHLLQEDKKLLIIVATDGEPTDVEIVELEHILRVERHPTSMIPVTFLACTDDEDAIGYLNKWDKDIPNLDVIDDYQSERKQIQNVQGKNFRFSEGDHIARMLLGPVVPELDRMDEVVLSEEFK